MTLLPDVDEFFHEYEPPVWHDHPEVHVDSDDYEWYDDDDRYPADSPFDTRAEMEGR